MSEQEQSSSENERWTRPPLESATIESMAGPTIVVAAVEAGSSFENSPNGSSLDGIRREMDGILVVQ